jgi:SNF2 family DNA or RNA helicase
MDTGATTSYSLELTHEHPFASQPSKIITPLKPHQRTALAKALQMERTGLISYQTAQPTHYGSTFNVRTNLGVIGDIVGYGKTLIAASLIAENPTHQIHQDKYKLYASYTQTSYSIIEQPREYSNYIETTLIIVPRGPVFNQWIECLRNETTLNFIALDSVHTMKRVLPAEGLPNEDIVRQLNQWDAILIKDTMVKKLLDKYTIPYRTNPLYCWDRIIVDEAHITMYQTPFMRFKYLWMITSSYPVLRYRNSHRTTLSYSIRFLDDELLNVILVKNNPEFVRQSFELPQVQENHYMCKLPNHLSAIQPFLQPDIQQRIHAGDIHGAIRAMGGREETEDELVTLVTQEINRDIANREREMAYTQSLEIPEESKEQRLKTIQEALKQLNERKIALTERITALSTQTCSICYDNFNSPVMLKCTHIYCGNCLVQWMRNQRGVRACPTCRQPIESSELVAIVDTPSPNSKNELVPLMSKEDQVLWLIRNNPQGKFLIFSRYDTNFWKIMKRLSDENITTIEMKGSTTVMVKNLEAFRRGDVKVILLNTHHAGSGIDISCATDVIIYHSMGIEKLQAVGRAQRVGRSTQLTIHNLCYPSEL